MVNEVNQAMRSYSRKTMLLPTFQMIYDVKLKNPETLLRAVGGYENPEVVVSWESEATPSATPFFKRAYKISHPPRLWVSWIDLPSFASSSKIWPNFSNKVFFSWSYEKVILTKNVRLTYYSSMKKKFRKIRMIFDIENSLWKSNFRTLHRAGKARQSIPERS